MNCLLDVRKYARNSKRYMTTINTVLRSIIVAPFREKAVIPNTATLLCTVFVVVFDVFWRMYYY